MNRQFLEGIKTVFTDCILSLTVIPAIVSMMNS